MTEIDDRCPAGLQEVAEAYCLGTLPEAEALIFEDHYLTCSQCATVLETTATYVQSMQEAARQLRRAGAANSDEPATAASLPTS